MRVWDAGSGRCASVVQVGGRVDSLLLEGGFLFVGLHVQGVAPPPGLIKARCCRPAHLPVHAVNDTSLPPPAQSVYNASFLILLSRHQAWLHRTAAGQRWSPMMLAKPSK